MITFWKTGALAEKLKRGEIGERDAFQYLLAGSVLWTVTLYYSVTVGARYGWLLFYELIVVLTITIFGLLKCFEANGGSGGIQFVLRATCLSFPIGIKVNVLSEVVGRATYYFFPVVVDATSFRDPTRVYNLFMFLLAAGWAIVFYWRLWVHLSAITHTTPNAPLNRTRADDARAG